MYVSYKFTNNFNLKTKISNFRLTKGILNKFTR